MIKLDLWTCSRNGTCSYVGDLLYIFMVWLWLQQQKTPQEHRCMITLAFSCLRNNTEITLSGHNIHLSESCPKYHMWVKWPAQGHLSRNASSLPASYNFFLPFKGFQCLLLRLVLEQSYGKVRSVAIIPILQIRKLRLERWREGLNILQQNFPWNELCPFLILEREIHVMFKGCWPAECLPGPTYSDRLALSTCEFAECFIQSNSISPSQHPCLHSHLTDEKTKAPRS